MIPPILRDPAGASRERFDLVVVGGGIQGIMLALEATRRRLRPVLIERDDFASGTSYNSLRILHGGLRYLQRLDLGRSRTSICERAWWLRWFPDLVHPLPCLMPLYGGGPRRPAVMQAGLKANDLLCALLVRPRAERLPHGRIASPDEVQSLFDLADSSGLKGGAIWHDAWAPNAPRLCIEALRWACSEGATVLNRVEACGVASRDGHVTGVRARDLESGNELLLRAPLVVTAAGADTEAFLIGCGLTRAAKRLPRQVLAWNVCFRRPPLSTHGLAVKRPGAGHQTHFLVPWKGGFCAGTPYVADPDPGDDRPPKPTDAHLDRFIDDLNGAIRGLNLTLNDAVHVYAGRLSGGSGALAAPLDRATVLDHATAGGPDGFFTVVTPKLTTARAVAERLLGRLFPGAHCTPEADRARPPAPYAPDWPLDWSPAARDDAWIGPLIEAHVRDAALHLDDLLLRHSSIGDDPARALRLAQPLADALGFTPERRALEIERLRAAVRTRIAAPRGSSDDEALALAS